MATDEGYEGFFGERVASVYDEDAAIFDPAVVAPVVDMLESLAGRGRALEFGIGTGRIALPLAERGVRVVGIDDSDAMVARLRAKPRGADIEVTIGDFATTRVGGEFSLGVPRVQHDLQPGDAGRPGRMLPERRCSSPERWAIRDRDARSRSAAPPAGPDHIPFRADPDGLSFDVYDVVTQRFSSQHYHFSDAGIRATPVEFRYAWPAELDLMARLAGLTLAHRSGGWQREPFTSLSRGHVSVYEKP